eukprot:1999974-Rhodomonas_salina.2
MHSKNAHQRLPDNAIVSLLSVYAPRLYAFLFVMGITILFTVESHTKFTVNMPVVHILTIMQLFTLQIFSQPKNPSHTP